MLNLFKTYSGHSLGNFLFKNAIFFAILQSPNCPILVGNVRLSIHLNIEHILRPTGPKRHLYCHDSFDSLLDSFDSLLDSFDSLLDRFQVKKEDF